MKTSYSLLYSGKIITVDGVDFKVIIDQDEFCGAPWEEEDGHGPVDCRRHSPWGSFPVKMPGEVIIGEYRGMTAFYDFQQAVKQAKKEGWNTEPFTFRTRGEQADAAARADMEHLARWLRERWMYAVLTVEALDDSGDVLPYVSATLGGVAYDEDDTSYAMEEAIMLARQAIAEHQGMFSRLPMTQDVIEPDEELGDVPDFDDDLSLISVAA